jgi:hypothetical protein
MKRRKKMFTTNTMRFMLLWAIIFSTSVTVVTVSLAQTNNNEKQSTYEESQKRIVESQKLLKEEITKIKAASESQAQDKRKKSPSIIIQQLELLQKIDLIYDQQIFAIQKSFDLVKSAEQLKEELSAAVSKTKVPDPPYSFIQLDELKGRLILLEEQKKSVTKAVKTSEDFLQAKKEESKTKDQALRRIKEELEAEKKSLITSPVYIIAELSKRLLGEEVNLQKLSLENVKLEQVINQHKRELIQENISFLEPRITFTRKELQEQILKLEKDALTIKSALEKVKAKEDLANSRWLNAKEQLVGKTVSPSEVEQREKEVVQWKSWNDTYRLEVEILGKNIDYLDKIKKIWEYRYALFNNTASVDLAGWTKEFDKTFEELEREKRLVAMRSTDCNNEMNDLEKKLESARLTSEPTVFIEEQLEALKPRVTLLKQGFESIQSTQKEIQKLQNEIARREKNKSLKEYLSNVWAISRQVWEYEITSVEDHPVTVGKMIIALVLLVVGLILAKRLSLQTFQHGAGRCLCFTANTLLRIVSAVSAFRAQFCEDTPYLFYRFRWSAGYRGWFRESEHC